MMSSARADKISFDDRLGDRLARLEGQVGALRRMVTEERDCDAILTQLLAARSAFEKAGQMILDRHLSDCVLSGIELPDGKMDDLRAALDLWARQGRRVS